MRIEISRDHLKAVSMFAAQGDDIRYYINSVLVEVSKAQIRLCATDGHTLAICKLDAALGELEKPFEFLMPIDTVKTITKWESKKTASHLFQITVPDELTGEFRVESGENVTIFRAVDGKFPDYFRVIPKTVSGETAYFNADYLARIQDANKLLGHGIAPAFAYNGDSAALAVINDSFIAIVMPIQNEALKDASGAVWATKKLV